jgi:2'-5' RNA ligase
MGKKRIRKTITSKGQRRSIVAGVKEVRAERSPFEVAMNKLKAWKKGQNPWITVEGPQTNKRFVKVRANNLYGDPKKASYGIYGKPSTNE